MPPLDDSAPRWPHRPEPQPDMSKYTRLLQEALDHGGNTHTIADVVDVLHEGRAALFAAPNSVIVAELIRYPQLDAMRIWLAAGELDELLAMEPLLIDVARAQGARRLEIGGGRPGWERALKGYKRLCPCAVKEI